MALDSTNFPSPEALVGDPKTVFEKLDPAIQAVISEAIKNLGGQGDDGEQEGATQFLSRMEQAQIPFEGFHNLVATAEDEAAVEAFLQVLLEMSQGDQKNAATMSALVSKLKRHADALRGDVELAEVQAEFPPEADEQPLAA